MNHTLKYKTQKYDISRRKHRKKSVTLNTIYERKIKINWTLSSQKLCFAKDTLKRMKRKSKKWEKHLKIIYMTKDLYPEYIKKTNNLN